jgi:transcriptional regulator with PAS, ATPase and Fis domain
MLLLLSALESFILFLSRISWAGNIAALTNMMMLMMLTMMTTGSGLFTAASRLVLGHTLTIFIKLL